MILTRRGWLKHDEVPVGDETIGYNRVRERSEWTSITCVVHYDDAPLIRLGNKRWSVLTTPNHRWLNEAPVSQDSRDPVRCTEPGCSWPEGVRRRGRTTAGGYRIHMALQHGVNLPQRDNGTEIRFVSTEQIKLSGHYRLRIAAPTDTGQGLPLTDQEAALLGWIAGDGSVFFAPRGALQVSIGQAKREHFPAVEAALDGLPHRRYEYPERTSSVTWMLSPDYARDLMARAGHPKDDAFRMVLKMSASQRRSWLAAMIAAEGTRNGSHVRIFQTEGPIAEAIRLAIYLEGYRPSQTLLTGKDQWASCYSIGMTRPHVTPLVKEDGGRGQVWCVTTELGTWTAGTSDGLPFLTGNSNAAAGRTEWDV